MKISQTNLTPYALPLQRQWRSQREKFSVRTGWLLELEDTDGNKGYGDCAPLPSHGTETEIASRITLESALPNLTGLSTSDCLDILPDAKAAPAARCALETALLDLMAKQRNMPMHQYLNPGSRPKVKVNAAIGALGEGSLQRVISAIDKGCCVIKLKVGINEPNQELELLTRICADLPPTIQLRLDANQAWDTATAKKFLNGIHRLPIESLEEPLAQPEIKKLAQLQDTTDITLALDETMAGLSPEDLSQLHHLRRIILKPMALGGPLPSLHMGQRAQEFGIEVVVTTTVDSAAGVWAATHLAAALDVDGRFCHGVVTSEWLQQDLGTGPHIQNGNITIPRTSGLSFIPYP